MLAVVVNLSFLVYVTISYSYDCSDTNSLCKNTKIECLSNEDCFISCNNDKLCQNSMIECPINGNCNIECLGYKSCQNVIINATKSITGNLNITCQDASQECESLRIYGSLYQHTNTQQQNDLSLTCNGDVQSCYKSKIQCPASGDCLIHCQADESCKNNTITGPSNGDLNVECTGTDSCIQSTIKGENADELDLSGCAIEDSCLDLTIYCPPMANISNPNCFIQGNDNLGSYSGRGIIIYAINGWQDVEISYTGSYGLRHQGTMHCGVDYESSCSFASSSWECSDIDAYCNNVWTPEPTMEPTDVIDDREYNNTYWDGTYPPIPDINKDRYDGALGMILIGGGLICLAFGCVICGAIRKQLDKAERKLSEMGIKSPFKSPYSGPAPPGHIHHGGHHAHPHSNKHKKGGHGHGHGHKHKHKHGKNLHMQPQRIDDIESSYSHGANGAGIHRANSGHNSGYYATHGITRPNTAPANGTYTANIHRPDSTSHNKYIINHNGTRTAEINRPHSAQQTGHDNNYNDYGQHHLAQLGVHGHSGHNNKGFRGGNGHNQHQKQHRHQQSSHGHGHRHGPGHKSHTKPSNTEMMIMNDVRIR